ncbi:MAG: HAD-IA family hydrolase [Calditrichaeota bacterium]|nr:HAD-IA family hydrolase [Calditrichota bacterium]
MKFQTLIFDLDGTLAETRHDIAAATNHTRRHFDLQPLNVETIRSYIGDGITKLLQRALPPIPESQMEEAYSVFTDYYSQHLADTTKLYPGILEFLKDFSHLKIAVLSNKAQLFTDKIVDALDIRRFFAIVLGSKDDVPKKPAADAIEIIISKLNIEKESVLMIGDSKNDILAGQAAGIKTCAVSWGFRPESELKNYNPDIIIHTIEELKKYVETKDLL